MTHDSPRTPSQRQLRVGEEVRHALAWIFERGELHDPALTERPVTVTEVQMSPDLRHARVFVMPLGGGHGEPVVSALRRASGFLRHRLRPELKLKFMPDFSFLLDRSFEQAERITTLLHDPQVARDLDPSGASPAGDAADDR